MAVGKKGSSIADAGFSFAGGAPADCNEFAKRIFIADLQIRRLTLIFQVLRLLSDRAGSVKSVFRSALHGSAKSDGMFQPAIWPAHHVGSDDAIRTNNCLRANFSSGINDRGRMNPRAAHLVQPLTSVLSPLSKERGGRAMGCALACSPWRAVFDASPFVSVRGGWGFTPLIYRGT